MNANARTAIAAIRSELNAAFPERRNVVDGLLAAILSGQHVLLLGLPGTAKSALTRVLSGALGGGYFERLLTRFSVPEELFGPVSLKGLEQDRYERVIAGQLPEARFAFLDEVFKANSAILNALLTLINERTYHNGNVRLRCPLVSVFGASNELPDGKDLEALWDRFLLRFDVQYLVQPANFRRMLLASEPAITAALSPADLAAAQAEVDAVRVTDATVDALITIRDSLRAEGIVVSDRRWKQALRLTRAVAWLAGSAETCPEDLTVLSDCLWREPKERAKLAAIVGRHADPAGAKVQEILDAARELTAATNAQRGNPEAFVAAAVKSNRDLQAQVRKLRTMETDATPRTRGAIGDAVTEINAIAQDFARAVSAGMGLRSAS